MEKLFLANEKEYKKYFINNFCNKEIFTYDNLKVKFYEDQFEHCFFESKDYQKRDKSIFSIERSERMNWIKETLKNPKTEMFVGWDRDRKTFNYKRRISLISPENYVVVINIIDSKKAKFITAYPASETNATKIRNNPKWKTQKKPLIAGSVAETSRDLSHT